MGKTSGVPGSRTLMPIVVEILQNNGGSLNYMQVVYLVMFKYNIEQKMFKKARNEVGFSGVYLRKIGALKTDTKKGVWTLTPEYKDLSFEEAKSKLYKAYDEKDYITQD